MFDHILLEPEQEDLLITLVEAARNVLRENRQKFALLHGTSGALILHPGFGDRTHNAYGGDVEILGGAGLLALSHSRNGTLIFAVTPLGFRYYEHLKQRLGQPIQQVEATIRSFLDAEAFQRKYPSAYQKWAEAETILWSSDSEQQLTTIGHLCREAVQEFAATLVDQYKPPNVTDNKASTVARVKAVLNMQSEKLGTTVKPLMDALLVYWGTTSDLIQRQEHGGQREGHPLGWEDGRRVIFNTAVAMFEIDRALS